MLFLFVSCYIQYFLTIPVVREKIKVRLALAIPIGAPSILVNEIIYTSLLVALKTIKVLSNVIKSSLFKFLLHDFL